MDRGRRIAARVLVALALVVASLALSAWWAQAVAAREFPLVTTVALHSVESAVVGQLQARAGPAGLPPQARQAALGALDSAPVRSALATGDPGPAITSALVKADPALAPVLKSHPLAIPPVGRAVNRDAQRVRPLAQIGAAVAVVLCALALALATDRFRVLRRIGRWGLFAGGIPLLVAWALPVVLGLQHTRGAVGSIARTGLGATVGLRGLSVSLCIAGGAVLAVGIAGPYLMRFLARSAASRQIASSVRSTPAPGSAAVVAPGGVSGALSSSTVDVRI
jgi:hypothetical protein